MFKKLRNIILAGILVLLPLVASIYILWYLFVFIDNWSSPLVELIFQRDVPGAGLILTIIIIFLAGILATNIIGKKIIQKGEILLLKIPLFRNIYISIKQILEGMFSQKAESFKTAVLFEYPRRGVYQIGFITRESSPYLNKVTGLRLYKIFLPTTPNPTSGMFVLVPESDVTILNLNIEDALKLIISAGIISPELKEESVENMRKGNNNEKN